MADEPKPADSPTPPPPADSSATPPAGGAAPAAEPAPAPAGGPQPDPLSDGTTPTILATGDGHRSVPKGKASITGIYRRADIMTTLFTFIGALVASGIIVGAYVYLTRSKTPTTAAPTKVTTLDKAELDKLDSFFDGNSAGKTAEVLTVSSSSLFKGRMAVDSDLKVTGALGVSGGTSLASLTVDKNTLLAATTVRGSLTVAGPTVLQSPTTLGAGATVTGNLAVSGNGSFGGSVSAGTVNAANITVSSNLNLNGHLSIGGQNPTAAPVTASSASVNGNDAAGTVTIGSVSSSLQTAELAWVTFRNAYPRAPTVVITPVGRCSALVLPHVQVTATRFMVGAAKLDASCNALGYAFNYWVVQ